MILGYRRYHALAQWCVAQLEAVVSLVSDCGVSIGEGFRYTANQVATPFALMMTVNICI
jgi:hypothetical protein